MSLSGCSPHAESHHCEYLSEYTAFLNRSPWNIQQILVTHHVTLCLPATAYIVELNFGRVLHHGSVEDLRERGILAQVIEGEDVHVKEDDPSASASTASIPHDADAVTESPFQKALDVSDGKLVDAETRAEGRVSVKTYLTYVRAAGWVWWVVTFILLVRIPSSLNHVVHVLNFA